MKSERKGAVTAVMAMLLALLLGCESQQQTVATPASPRVELGEHEHSKEFGDYIVHVNALTTDQLPAVVARSYDIRRSASRALLNVVIMKRAQTGIDTPVAGNVSASTTNLAGQLKNMPLRKITEQDAIYYIGDTPVSDKETLVFDIDITPENETSSFGLRYRQQFFTN